MIFRFASPEILWLLLLIPAAALWRGKKGKAAALRFPSAALAGEAAKTVRGGAGRLLASARWLALALLVIALARPQFGSSSSEIESSGIDIVLALDLSTSMWAHDFEIRGQPVDRLTVVKNVVREFIQKRPNDRIGVVAFAANPYLVSPLTLNHDWLLQNLDRLRIGMIEDGTAIGSALAMCVNRLRAQTAKSRIIVLLTDGGNNRGKITPVAAAEAAAAFKIKIYAVGAGREGQVPYPYIDRDGNPILDARGNMRFGYIESDVDEETLKKIADKTSGKFYRATATKELTSIYQDIDKLEKTEVKMKFRTAYDDMFAWPAAAGLILLAFEQLLSQTRYRRLP